MRLATAAFYANANVSPKNPLEVIPYDSDKKVEHVTHEQFVKDYRRMKGNQ